MDQETLNLQNSCCSSDNSKNIGQPEYGKAIKKEHNKGCACGCDWEGEEAEAARTIRKRLIRGDFE